VERREYIFKFSSFENNKIPSTVRVPMAIFIEKALKNQLIREHLGAFLSRLHSVINFITPSDPYYLSLKLVNRNTKMCLDTPILATSNMGWRV
jgi:hypothetical protein